jgi:serine/threonine-protein kinase RsbW
MTEFDQSDERAFAEIVVPSTLEAARHPEERILEEVRRQGYGNEVAFAVKLALEEALTNAVKHGNCNDPGKSIVVRYAVTRERAVIIVRDEGCGFEPDGIPDCTKPERLSVPNGRGIMLMRAYMDEVYYRAGGREVYMSKRRHR